MFQDLKDSKNDRPEILRFTIHHQLFKKYRGLFKIALDLKGFTYCLRSSTIIQDLLRFYRRPKKQNNATSNLEMHIFYNNYEHDGITLIISYYFTMMFYDFPVI